MNKNKTKWKGKERIKELQCESIKDNATMFGNAPIMAQNKLQKKTWIKKRYKKKMWNLETITKNTQTKNYRKKETK
jgi:hypothetical protein